MSTRKLALQLRKGLEALGCTDIKFRKDPGFSDWARATSIHPTLGKITTIHSDRPYTFLGHIMYSNHTSTPILGQCTSNMRETGFTVALYRTFGEDRHI